MKNAQLVWSRSRRHQQKLTTESLLVPATAVNCKNSDDDYTWIDVQVTEVISNLLPEDSVEQIYIFGRCENGKSLGMVIDGFKHYFYVHIDENSSSYSAASIREQIIQWATMNRSLVNNVENVSLDGTSNTINNKKVYKSMNGYSEENLKNVFRIYVHLRSMVNSCITSFRQTFNNTWQCTFYETDVSLSTRFTIDTSIHCGQWIKLATSNDDDNRRCSINGVKLQSKNHISSSSSS